MLRQNSPFGCRHFFEALPFDHRPMSGKLVKEIIQAGGNKPRTELRKRKSSSWQPEKLLESKTAKALIKAGLSGKNEESGRTVVYWAREKVGGLFTRDSSAIPQRSHSMAFMMSPAPEGHLTQLSHQTALADMASHSSSKLQRESGGPCLAGSSHAKALTCTKSSGGKDRGDPVKQ